MSWMQKLYETYEFNSGEVGVMREKRVPLYPAYHFTQLAQVEAVLDIDGNWCPGRSRVIEDKEEMTTIIPVTEKSASRTSSPEPHPLHDKLQYVAGDYAQFGVKKRYAFPAYMAALDAWCASPYAHPGVRAVQAYLKKGRLIQDLAADGLLYRAPDGAFPEKWPGDKKEAPPIFRACASQLDAFVRFVVIGGEGEARLWENAAVRQSWISYQDSAAADYDTCYVLGRPMPVSVLSPKKIRNAGDGAKLISGNDMSGFTFRGRFATPQQAVCIGRETTEKAHSALRWLISRQGYVNGDQVILAWSTKVELPRKVLSLDTLDLAGSYEGLMGSSAPLVSNMGEFAKRFRLAAAGYRASLKGGEEAAVIGLDSATPGRLSIFYYRELQADDLLARIEAWHSTCTWLHRYRFVEDGEDEKGKVKYRPAPFIGAPAPKEIVEAAYGANVDDKLRKSAMERLLPCIVDGARLPLDLMLCAVRRASRAAAFNKTEAGRTTSIACALVRKYYNQKRNDEKEEWILALDENQGDRSYLFGRALAYARKLEELAQWVSDNEARQTNAERLQAAFTQHPAHVWQEIYGRLLPYLARLRTSDHKDAKVYEAEMNAVVSRIAPEDFLHDKALEPVYLLGYQSQMNVFQAEIEKRVAAKKEKEKKAKEEEEGKKDEHPKQ